MGDTIRRTSPTRSPMPPGPRESPGSPCGADGAPPPTPPHRLEPPAGTTVGIWCAGPIWCHVGEIPPPWHRPAIRAAVAWRGPPLPLKSRSHLPGNEQHRINTGGGGGTPVVDVADVLVGVAGGGPQLPQEVQHALGQHRELAVLNELAEVQQPWGRPGGATPANRCRWQSHRWGVGTLGRCLPLMRNGRWGKAGWKWHDPLWLERGHENTGKSGSGGPGTTH